MKWCVCPTISCAYLNFASHYSVVTQAVCLHIYCHGNKLLGTHENNYDHFVYLENFLIVAMITANESMYMSRNLLRWIKIMPLIYCVRGMGLKNKQV